MKKSSFIFLILFWLVCNCIAAQCEPWSLQGKYQGGSESPSIEVGVALKATLHKGDRMINLVVYWVPGVELEISGIAAFHREMWMVDFEDNFGNTGSLYIKMGEHPGEIFVVIQEKKVKDSRAARQYGKYKPHRIDSVKTDDAKH